MLQSTQLIEHTAQCPYIRFERVWFAFTHFRAHIVWRAHHSWGCIVGSVQQLRNTKIAQLDCILLSQENVLRFDVSVKNLTSMDVLECCSNLYEPIKYLLLGESLTFLLLLLNVVGQVSNFTVLHLYIQHILLNKTGHVWHNVRVSEMLQ